MEILSPNHRLDLFSPDSMRLRMSFPQTVTLDSPSEKDRFAPILVRAGVGRAMGSPGLRWNYSTVRVRVVVWVWEPGVARAPRSTLGSVADIPS